jgi:hypothetical protein
MRTSGVATGTVEIVKRTKLAHESSTDVLACVCDEALRNQASSRQRTRVAECVAVSDAFDTLATCYSRAHRPSLRQRSRAFHADFTVASKNVHKAGLGSWNGLLQNPMNTLKSKKLWLYAAISLTAAGPAGGFLFGATHAGDPDPNPIGRFFYACLMAVQTPLHAGFPPHPEAGAGQTFNLWPYIATAYVLIFGWLMYRDWRRGKKRNASTA